MIVQYTRQQRESKKHPAKIGDIPYEVIQKAFKYLDYLKLERKDLRAASMVCRAWYPAALELMADGKSFQFDLQSKLYIERFLFGLLLKRLALL